ncbi:MAG: YIP1 family protein [Euryarchaeota archaeon]|nr:YIP1 family protein [Euryarchaeota archaeon]
MGETIGLVEIAKGIMLSPKDTLAKLKPEKVSTNDLLLKYVAILAVLPFIGTLIGYSFVGFSVGWGFAAFTLPIQYALILAIVTYVLTIAGVFVEGFVINALAPTFSAKQDQMQAMKVAAYASTPWLVAGILNIVPVLSILVLIAGLYGLYIAYLGLLSLMETPKEKVLGYLIAVIVVVIVVWAVIGFASSRLVWSFYAPPTPFGYGRFGY